MHYRSITRDNATLQIVRSLKDNRQKRAKRKQIFVEGVAPLTAAVGARLRADLALVPAGRPRSGWADDTIAALDPPELYEVDAELFAGLSDREDPSQLIAVLQTPTRSLPRVAPDAAIAIVDRPANPGNLGSLIRSANGFGIASVVSTGHGADLYDPVTIRASRGAVFATPVVHEPSIKVLLDWIAAERARLPRLRLIGTDSTGALSIAVADPRPPIIVVFGNEATGLSQTLSEVVDEIVRIDLRGTVDSLNLACAASVVFYAITGARAPG